MPLDLVQVQSAWSWFQSNLIGFDFKLGINQCTVTRFGSLELKSGLAKTNKLGSETRVKVVYLVSRFKKMHKGSNMGRFECFD